MKAEETNLGTVGDLFRWAVIRLYHDFDYTTDDIERMLARELSGIEHFSEKQVKTAFSYTNANDIVENGVKGR